MFCCGLSQSDAFEENAFVKKVALHSAVQLTASIRIGEEAENQALLTNEVFACRRSCGPYIDIGDEPLNFLSLLRIRRIGHFVFRIDLEQIFPILLGCSVNTRDNYSWRRI